MVSAPIPPSSGTVEPPPPSPIPSAAGSTAPPDRILLPEPAEPEFEEQDFAGSEFPPELRPSAYPYEELDETAESEFEEQDFAESEFPPELGLPRPPSRPLIAVTETTTFQPIPPGPDSKNREFSQRQRFYALVLAGVILLIAAAILLIKSRDEGDPVTVTTTRPNASARVAPVSVKYAFSPGETRSYTMSVKTTSTPSGISGASPAESTMRATVLNRVARTAEDGSAVLDLTFDEVTLQPVSPSSIEGRRMQISIAPDGRITSIDGAEGIFSTSAGALKAIAALPSAGPTDAVTPQMLFPAYPPTAVVPGAAWTRTSTVPFPYGDEELTITSNGRLDGVSDDRRGKIVRFNEKGTVPVDVSFNFGDAVRSIAAASGRPSGAVASELANATMTIAGNVEFETDTQAIASTGEIVRLDSTMNSTMNMSLPPTTSAAGATATPTKFTVKSTTQISLVPLDASGADTSPQAGTSPSPAGASPGASASPPAAVATATATVRPGAVPD